MTKIYACDKCEKEFQNISMFKQHTKDHQKQPKATKAKTTKWTNFVQNYHQKQPKAKGRKTKNSTNFVQNFQKEDLEDAAERFVTIFKEDTQESKIDENFEVMPLHSNNGFDKKEDHQKQPKAKGRKTKNSTNFVQNFQKNPCLDLEDAAERFVTIFKEEKQESIIEENFEVLPLHSNNVFDKKGLEQRYEARVSKWDDMMEKFKKYDEEYDDQYGVEDLEKWAKDVDYSTDEESVVQGKKYYNFANLSCK